MQAHTLKQDDGEVAYYSAGAGFPIVFVHGFPMDHTVWTHFIESFTHDHRVLLPDNAGFGKSSLPRGPVTMEVHAGRLKAILDHEGISSCLMIGHSMGGYIAMNFASRFPQYLKGLGLFHSTAYADDAAKKQSRVEVAAIARSSAPAAFVDSMLHKLFSPHYVAGHESEIAALKQHFGDATTSEAIAQASLAMGERSDTSAFLKSTAIPVLFIIGREDQAVSPDRTLELVPLPLQSVVNILAGVAHMGMFEATAATQQAVMDWVALSELK